MLLHPVRKTFTIWKGARQEKHWSLLNVSMMIKEKCFVDWTESMVDLKDWLILFQLNSRS